MPNDDKPNEGQMSPEELKELRAAANRSKQAAADADAARREVAFMKVVGVDQIDHPLIQRLMASYDGDLSKEQVSEYLEGLQVNTLLKPTGTAEPAPSEPTPTAPAATTTATAEEQRQTAERTGVIDGGEPPSTLPTEHPARTGLTKAFEIIERGGSREDGASAFFSELFGAAVAGDQRVLTTNAGGEYVRA